MKFKISVPKPYQAITVVVFGLIFMTLCMAVGRAKNGRQGVRPVEVEPLVSSFIDEYLSPEFQYWEGDNAFYRYFACLEGETPETIDEYEVSPPEDDFSTVFESLLPGGKDAIGSYTLEPVSDNFCIVRIYYVETGEVINPPVGLWYKLSSDGSKIEDYYVARLLPFSRYDPEFSEEWNEIK